MELEQKEAHSLTLKKIPDALYGRLCQAAKANRRSLNAEILVCLEGALGIRQASPVDTLSELRRLRRKTAHHPLTDEDLDQAKRSGRA